MIWTSASSCGVPALPAMTTKRTEPLKPVLAPFQSGVPTVTLGEAPVGGVVTPPHDGCASGGPWLRFGDVHCGYATVNAARNGVAPLGRGKPGLTSGCHLGSLGITFPVDTVAGSVPSGSASFSPDWA